MGCVLKTLLTMSSYELYIPQARPMRNIVNGRFLKGHVPANKGKKWSDYMGKRAQRRCARGWENLRLHRNKNGRPDNAGRCRKPVVAIDGDGKWHWFPYIGAAALWAGGCRENVGRCCRANAAQAMNRRTGEVNTDHKYKGYRFYFFTDDNWTKKTDYGL